MGIGIRNKKHKLIMKFITFIILFAAGVILGTGSCKKETNTPAANYTSCKLIQFDDDKIDFDSLGKFRGYTYPSPVPHALTKSTWFLYFSSGDLLIFYPIMYWNGYYGVSFDNYHRVSYVSNQTSYDEFNQYGPHGLINTMEFTYSPDGRGVTILYRDGKDSTLIHNDICTLNKDTEIVHVDNFDTTGKLVSTIDIQYDNQKNPMHAVFSPDAWDDYFRFFPAKHNVTRITTTPVPNPQNQELISFAYTYNSSGYPVTRQVMNRAKDYYSYDCK
jgi:hypothetical protein